MVGKQFIRRMKWRGEKLDGSKDKRYILYLEKEGEIKHFTMSEE